MADFEGGGSGCCVKSPQRVFACSVCFVTWEGHTLSSAGQGKHTKAGAYQGREAERAEGRGQEAVPRPPAPVCAGRFLPFPRNPYFVRL